MSAVTFDTHANAVSSLESPPAESAASALRTVVMDAQGWDELALRFSDVVHEQTQCFNGGRYPDHQIERIAYWDDAELAAAAVLRTMAIPGTGVRFTSLRWGPMWRPEGRLVSTDMLERVCRHLTETYASAPRDFMLLMPRCDPVANDAAPAILEAAGFNPQSNPGFKPRYFVDVSLDPDTLRGSLAQKWRYNLKKSEKQGLTIDVLEGQTAFDQFEAMHRAMVERKGIRETGPIDTLAGMMAAPQPALRPLVFIVSHAGEAVAGAVIDISGEQANYLYGATTDRALPLRAGYFMQWQIVAHLSARPGTRWYGLGGGSSPTCSLHQFKRGLAGKAGLVVDEPDTYYRAGSTYAALVGTAATRLRWWQMMARHEMHIRLAALRGG